MKGGDEHSSVGSGVKPAAAVAVVLLGGFGAVYHYLFFEGIPEQLEIAVCLVVAVVVVVAAGHKRFFLSGGKPPTRLQKREKGK